MKENVASRVRYDKVSLKKTDSSRFELFRKQSECAKIIRKRILERQEYKMICDRVETALALAPKPFLSYLVENSSNSNHKVDQSWGNFLEKSGLYPIPLKSILNNANLLSFFETKVLENFLKRQAEEEKLKHKEVVLHNFAVNLDAFLESQSDAYQKPRILLQLSGKCQILPHEKGQISAFLSMLNSDLSGHGFFNNHYENRQNPSLYDLNKLSEGWCVFNIFSENVIDEIVKSLQALVLAKIEKLKTELSNFKTITDVINYFHAFYPQSFKMITLRSSKFEFPAENFLNPLRDLIDKIGEINLNSSTDEINIYINLFDLFRGQLEKLKNSNIVQLSVKLSGQTAFEPLPLYSLEVGGRSRLFFSIVPKGEYCDPFFDEFEEDVFCIIYAGINPASHKDRSR